MITVPARYVVRLDNAATDKPTLLHEAVAAWFLCSSSILNPARRTEYVAAEFGVLPSMLARLTARAVEYAAAAD